MNIDICVIAYNRPQYLKQCLDAILRLSAKPSCVSVFCDHGPQPRSYPSPVEIANGHTCVDVCVERGENVGIPLQWLDALDSPRRTGSDAVLVLEDDVIVEPLYLEAVQSMLETYKDPRITFVSSFPDKINPCWPPLPWTTGDHLLGVAITLEQWDVVRPYYLQFMDGDMDTIEGNRGKNPKAGQDVALYTAMAHLGKIPLFSEHRLARYIGEHGVHGTQEDFQEKGWEKLPIDTYFRHPPMNEWWLKRAIEKVQEHYLTPVQSSIVEPSQQK